MARARQAHEGRDSSDDDAPEVVSHSTSKADAKRDQRALHVFEVEEKARRKARNRKRDEKLKERARVTKGGWARDGLKGVRVVDGSLEGGESGDVEARMLKAMRDAAGEVDDEEEDEEFNGFVQDDDDGMSDSSFKLDEDDEEAGMSLGESDSIDPEAPTDDEDMDDAGEDETTLLHSNVRRPANYLSDDLFAAAFASQSATPLPKKNAPVTGQKPETDKKRRRKSVARAKDLVIGGRTIRTLPRLSDPRSQATARSVPSAHARKFVDQSLAIKGKRALSKAKERGWERRPANIGIMKCQGAPHGFARSTR